MGVDRKSHFYQGSNKPLAENTPFLKKKLHFELNSNGLR
jgi:hypothetical protein